MGYDDEAGRSRRRQSRGRRPVKPDGYRQDDYKRREESRRFEESRHREEEGYREASSRRRAAGNSGAGGERELNLITDTFRSKKQRPSVSPAVGKSGSSRRRNRTASRQTAAARQPSGGAYRTPVQKKAQKKKRRIIIILIEIVLLISVLVFAAFSYLNKSMNMIQRLPWDPGDIKNVDISEEKQEQMKGYWTIAVFGVDSRNSSVGKGNNSDVNMICNINQDTGEIKLVSVFRDTYMNVNDKNSYNKINAAYLNGGPEQAVKALNKNLDLDIDDYATFNWKAVADAINILGGIDLELTKAEFYYINAFVTETVKATGIPSEPVKHAGAVHLDGVQAVAYGRLRLMDTDYARTERQRKIISLAFDKAKKADWSTLNNIIQTVFPQVATSVELPDVLMMGRDMAKLHLGETGGFPADRSDMDMGSKGACVIPQTLESNVINLHSFLFYDEAYEPTETVKTISRKIISDAGSQKVKKTTERSKEIEESTEESETASGSESTKSGETEWGTKESGESGSSQSTRPGVSYETDSLGNVINPEIKESESGIQRPGTLMPETSGRPGITQPETSGRPGMTEPETSGRPGMTEPETSGRPGMTQPETITRPGVSPSPGETSGRPGSTVPNGGNAPGSDTDTGVILGPGAGGGGIAPGSGSTGFSGPTG